MCLDFVRSTGAKLALIIVLGLTSNLAATETDAIILPYYSVVISASSRGQIEAFLVKEGSVVKRGDLLASLDADLESYEAEQRAKDFERKQFAHLGTAKLFSENLTSAEEALTKKMEAGIAEIEHKKAVKVLEMKSIKAPLDGVIVRSLHEVGEWVEPGTELFDLVSIDKVYAQLLLLPEEAFKLKAGQLITVKLPELEGAPSFTGPVDFIAPVVDASSNLVRVKVLLDNADGRIRAGLRGLVQLP
ncbi:MAG: efflux RND transporter periplasmic adaptor subunit [Verrucomicrobiota bacterium]|nr:efflux RND transporter periplasmic adaptor subunit [Verrucomicrobiota bacterium]